MSRTATCDCGRRFDCDDRLAGGYTNCPSCERAVLVPGLRDPIWRLAQVAGIGAWVLAIAVSFLLGGGGAAVLMAIFGALVLWALAKFF